MLTEKTDLTVSYSIKASMLLLCFSYKAGAKREKFNCIPNIRTWRHRSDFDYP
jgi:hypothetical protein